MIVCGCRHDGASFDGCDNGEIAGEFCGRFDVGMFVIGGLTGLLDVAGFACEG